ncbi:hypothetical protein Fcan01_16993 [Folsomia candida]|uniref:Uncharacterized protein n=1 Tax=Folsomia candida TaxID=158441 RepID=A0A226DSI9_FOLCA|nr:hypothetical protein Fcan01_16993 [Folsomia candida]
MANLTTFMATCYSPVITTWISFTDNAPLYGFALYVLKVTSLNFTFRVVIATFASITFNIFASVIYLSALVEASGIVVLNVWTKILSKADISFSETIQIYNQLKVMTILMQEIGQDLVSVCLHHAFAVIMSTNAMYHFVLQFTSGRGMSILVTYTSLVTLFAATGIEMLAICFVAKSSSMSKEMLRNLLRNNGQDKYRRRVLRSMRPNSISFEFLDSVDSIRNGIGMDYFVRYLERVQSHTVTWLLATKHN